MHTHSQDATMFQVQALEAIQIAYKTNNFLFSTILYLSLDSLWRVTEHALLASGCQATIIYTSLSPCSLCAGHTSWKCRHYGVSLRIEVSVVSQVYTLVAETAVLVVYNCISTTRLTGLTHNSYFFQNNWQCFDQTVLWPAWCALAQFSVLAWRSTLQLYWKVMSK